MEKDAMNEIVVEPVASEVAGPSVDFTLQFSAAREHHNIERKLWNTLCEISNECHKEGSHIGLLIVVGNLDVPGGVVHGMRQIGDSPIKKYINAAGKGFHDDVHALLRANYDGAIIVNKDGQIIGAKIYLTVDNPSLEVPEGTGTRHITAASFSMREDIISVLTLSEENGTVRVWKKGESAEQYIPGEDEEDEEDKED